MLPGRDDGATCLWPNEMAAEPSPRGGSNAPAIFFTAAEISLNTMPFFVPEDVAGYVGFRLGCCSLKDTAQSHGIVKVVQAEDRW